MTDLELVQALGKLVAADLRDPKRIDRLAVEKREKQEKRDFWKRVHESPAPTKNEL